MAERISETTARSSAAAFAVRNHRVSDSSRPQATINKAELIAAVRLMRLWFDVGLAVNRRRSMTPPVPNESKGYRADRRRDRTPINT